MAQLQNLLINYLQLQHTAVDISTLSSILNNRFSTSAIMDACKILTKAGIFCMTEPEQSIPCYVIYRSAFVYEIAKLIRVYFDIGDHTNVEKLITATEYIAERENVGTVDVYLLLSTILEFGIKENMFFKPRSYCFECDNYLSFLRNSQINTTLKLDSLKEKIYQLFTRDVLPATFSSPCIICGLSNNIY